MVNRFKDIGAFLSTAETQLKTIIFDKITCLTVQDINLLITLISKQNNLEELRMTRMNISGPKVAKSSNDALTRIGRCDVPTTMVIQ